ncbi:MAG: HAD-IIIA family hydrolase [Lachnospiraceae bacterium]
MKVVLMAGRGSRISEMFPNIPKPLIPIDGVPVLEREIISLRDQGFTEIILTIGYMAEKIQNYFGNGNKWGVHISYFIEDKPLGNAGALFFLDLNEDFLLLNADAVFDVDFNRMVKYHKEKGGLVTLFTHPNSHPYDSGLIIAGEDKRVEKWLAKEDNRPLYYKNRVNAGLHVISPKALEKSGITIGEIGIENKDGNIQKVDLDRQILKPLCSTGEIFCYDSPEYVKDMGTPERLHSVEKDYKTGIVRTKNLAHKQRAIFLDRDGTINKYVGFLRSVDEMELTGDSAEAIRLINDSGYLTIVVTNQPVIARGEITYKELIQIHNKMETELGKKGAYLDGLYFCPHHPHSGYDGEIPELKINCECRKPKPGMLLRAAKEFNIDLEKSWMIGDSDSDVQAGIAAGCKSIKISEGSLLETVKGIIYDYN